MSKVNRTESRIFIRFEAKLKEVEPNFEPTFLTLLDLCPAVAGPLRGKLAEQSAPIHHAEGRQNGR